MVYALRTEKQVVEGGGVVALAALLSGKVDVKGHTVAVVIRGSNMDMGVLTELLMDEKAAAETARSASLPQ
jgi:threonine dehydratase